MRDRVSVSLIGIEGSTYVYQDGEDSDGRTRRPLHVPCSEHATHVT